MSGGRSGWESAYAGTPPPWDIGRPQPGVVRQADAGAFRGRVLDAGCGTGENTLELARRGLAVWGVDGAGRAIDQARQKAADRGLSATFLVGDALDLESIGLTFDSVLDCGLFHTFGDDERRRYVASLSAVVATGGRLTLLCFSELEPWDGGPRRVSRAELRASFEAAVNGGPPAWRVQHIEPERFATRFHDDGARAWLASIERTDAPGSRSGKTGSLGGPTR
ncbi:MAG TPA: class I SAM-dependent methyltransferase [Candidatus Limnocylindrales bacterium]